MFSKVEQLRHFSVWVLHVEPGHTCCELHLYPFSLTSWTQLVRDSKYHNHWKTLGHCSWGGMDAYYIPSTSTFRQFRRKHQKAYSNSYNSFVCNSPNWNNSNVLQLEDGCTNFSISIKWNTTRAYREMDYRCMQWCV